MLFCTLLHLGNDVLINVKKTSKARFLTKQCNFIYEMITSCARLSTRYINVTFVEISDVPNSNFQIPNSGSKLSELQGNGKHNVSVNDMNVPTKLSSIFYFAIK
jgi:hypothetical protein